MGILFYPLCIFALLAAAVIAGIIRRRRSEASDKVTLSAEFGRSVIPDIEKIGIDHEKLDIYYRAFCDMNGTAVMGIDDITYNDLELDALFEQMNRTSCNIGEEYLYARMRAMNITGSDHPTVFDESAFFTENDELRTDLQYILKHDIGHSKQSTYYLFDKLLTADRIPITKDILSDIFVILAAGSVFIIPSIGIILLVIALYIAISGYSRRKKLYYDRLSALICLFRCIKCADNINDLLRKSDHGREFPLADRYENLAGKLRSLTYGSFLLPSRVGTYSDPFNILLDYFRMLFRLDIIVYSLKLSAIQSMHDDIYELYEVLGRTDTDISLASYIHSIPFYCRAKLDDEKNVKFNVRGLYHPYIKEPVCNDLSMTRSVILSGSNASGKSTFLKAIGMCVLMSQSFGFAPASEYNASYMRLFTSMALRDNMLKGESYYIVESKSIKRICEAADEGIPMMAIIDEVLRGTNTTDRIAASYSILKNLNRSNTLLAVATHDSELCELLNDIFDCRHFGEIIEDNIVYFPYVLEMGTGSSRNAIKLLDIIGFDKTVSDKAEMMANAFIENGRWEKL